MKYKIVKQSNKHLESYGKYYAKIVQNNVINSEQMVQELAKYSGVSEGIVLTVLTDLADLLKQHLQNGDVVDLDNIGRFKLKVSSEAIKTPDEFDPRKHIKSYKCLFSPATDGKGNKPIYPEK